MRHLTLRRRIEFSDTDLGGVVHFSRFFVFMESTEDAFLKSLGASFVFEHEGRAGGWPKVEASCEYLSPLHYDDELEISVEVVRITARSVTYGFTMRRGDTLIARGRTTSVHCARSDTGEFRAVSIPTRLAAALAGDPG